MYGLISYLYMCIKVCKYVYVCMFLCFVYVDCLSFLSMFVFMKLICMYV